MMAVFDPLGMFSSILLKENIKTRPSERKCFVRWCDRGWNCKRSVVRNKIGYKQNFEVHSPKVLIDPIPSCSNCKLLTCIYYLE
jgi:hypothetical protein